jgi:hypothetical protein
MCGKTEEAQIWEERKKIEILTLATNKQ